MPVSDLHGFTPIMNEVALLAPKTVLELGIGFGLYGVVCRQVLDAQWGRIKPESWTATIAGVESFGAYRNPAWELYDVVTDIDFTETVEPLHGWDLVMMIDSLEHLTPDVGRPFLRALVKNNKHIIVSVPNGVMPQGEVYGNPHEAHLWTFNGVEEFEPYKFELLHQAVCTVVSIEGEG